MCTSPRPWPCGGVVRPSGCPYGAPVLGRGAAVLVPGRVVMVVAGVLTRCGGTSPRRWCGDGGAVSLSGRGSPYGAPVLGRGRGVVMVLGRGV